MSFQTYEHYKKFLSKIRRNFLSIFAKFQLIDLNKNQFYGHFPINFVLLQVSKECKEVLAQLLINRNKW